MPGVGDEVWRVGEMGLAVAVEEEERSLGLESDTMMAKRR